MAERFGIDSMGETAENVAAELGVSREDQDAFALRSQERAARARRPADWRRRSSRSSIPQQKGEPLPRREGRASAPDTSLGQLAELKTPFRNGGSVTAGNASGVNDGAAAILVASGDAVARFGLQPLARVVGGGDSRCAAAHHGHRTRPGDQKAARASRPRDRPTSTSSSSTRRLRRRPWRAAGAGPPRGRRARQPATAARSRSGIRSA